MALPKHHAFVAYGSPSKVKEFAAYIAKECGVTAAHNPDFHIRDYSRDDDESSSLDVGQARELTDFAGMHGAEGTKVFVIAAQSITREAQNALLKTLEEPTADTIFALLVPRGALIDTVRSRMMEVPFVPQGQDDSLAKEFLRATPEARSTLIASILKEKDKEAARDLLDGVERLLMKGMHTPEVRRGLEDLARARSYIQDRSPSLKMLLEHLALVLPVTK